MLRQLRRARASFGAAAESDKRRLLAALAGCRLRSLRQLTDYHEDLLFLCAFPGELATRRLALQELAAFSQRWRHVPQAVRRAAEGSGIAGTVSRPLLAWPLVRELVIDEDIDLDLAGIEDPAAFDALLARLASPAEVEAFDSGDYSAAQWLALARPQDERALSWLARAGAEGPQAAEFAAAWDAAEVAVAWRLQDSRRAITHARLPAPRRPGRQGWRRLEGAATGHIVRPLEPIRRLSPREAMRVIGLARAALAARCREVHAMNHPNPREVHLADLGEGVELAVIGVVPAQRLLLEANYGYLLLSHGVPIGYGGVSPLFRQANTGINIFDPYRGSEAAFLWAQMLRAFRTLFGVRRFIINGYQFGAGNSEAIASGAYWFYFRLGFRPSVEENVTLAAEEADRLRRQPGTKTPAAVLRRLARGDLHLDLADFDRDDAFEESLLSRLGAVVARRLARTGAGSHHAGERALVLEVERALEVRDRAHWPAAERAGFARLAPYASLLDLGAWSGRERSALAHWLRSKGAIVEQDFAAGAGAQPRFFSELRALARAEAQRPA
jgi:hypothetical protein